MINLDDKIKDVLSFYAERKNYEISGDSTKETVIQFTKTDIDHGKKAQELLVKINELKTDRGHLFNSRCVLSGAIDRVADDGVQWRKYIKERCEEMNLGIKFFDPCDKPKSLGSEIGKEKIAVQKLIKEGQWKDAQELVKVFRHFDLRAIDWCDFVIAKIDINVHACGTYDEIFLAERENKIIFIIMGNGQTKKDIPSWLVSFINENEVFNTEDECIEYLLKLNNGDILLDERWVKLD